MEKLIDSHTHITDPALIADLDGIIQRAKKAGIFKMIDVCTDKTSLLHGLSAQQKYPSIYLAAAASPHDVDTIGDAFYQEVSQASEDQKLVAIGETGLDYHYKHSSIESQKKHLIKYIELGLKHNLPLIFHVREAFGDFFHVFDQFKLPIKGVLHCFTGSLEEALMGIEKGLYISFSGIITFPKSLALQETLKQIPLNKILIETDAPYLAPQSQRGKKNEPSFLVETAQMVAKLKNLSLKDVAQKTVQNTTELFGL